MTPEILAQPTFLVDYLAQSGDEVQFLLATEASFTKLNVSPAVVSNTHAGESPGRVSIRRATLDSTITRARCHELRSPWLMKIDGA